MSPMSNPKSQQSVEDELRSALSQKEEVLNQNEKMLEEKIQQIT